MRSLGILTMTFALVACSAGAGDCPDGSGPETVTVDASAYASKGPLRICISSAQDDAPSCAERGLSVTTLFDGAYPSSVDYEVYLAPEPEAPGTLLREGSLSLTCDETEIAVGFATPDPLE